jgi:hypothetical protein
MEGDRILVAGIFPVPGEMKERRFSVVNRVKFQVSAQYFQ